MSNAKKVTEEIIILSSDEEIRIEADSSEKKRKNQIFNAGQKTKFSKNCVRFTDQRSTNTNASSRTIAKNSNQTSQSQKRLHSESSNGNENGEPPEKKKIKSCEDEIQPVKKELISNNKNDVPFEDNKAHLTKSVSADISENVNVRMLRKFLDFCKPLTGVKTEEWEQIVENLMKGFDMANPSYTGSKEFQKFLVTSQECVKTNPSSVLVQLHEIAKEFKSYRVKRKHKDKRSSRKIIKSSIGESNNKNNVEELHTNPALENFNSKYLISKTFSSSSLHKPITRDFNVESVISTTSSSSTLNCATKKSEYTNMLPDVISATSLNLVETDDYSESNSSFSVPDLPTIVPTTSLNVIENNDFSESNSTSSVPDLPIITSRSSESKPNASFTVLPSVVSTTSLNVVENNDYSESNSISSIPDLPIIDYTTSRSSESKPNANFTVLPSIVSTKSLTSESNSCSSSDLCANFLQPGDSTNPVVEVPAIYVVQSIDSTKLTFVKVNEPKPSSNSLEKSSPEIEISMSTSFEKVTDPIKPSFTDVSEAKPTPSKSLQGPVSSISEMNGPAIKPSSITHNSLQPSVPSMSKVHISVTKPSKTTSIVINNVQALVPSTSETPVPSTSETSVPSKSETPVSSMCETPVTSMCETPVTSMCETPVTLISEVPFSSSKAPVPSTSNASVPSSKASVRSTSPVSSMSKGPIISMSKSPVPSMSKGPILSMSKSPVPSTSKAPVRSTSPVSSMSKGTINQRSKSKSPVPSMSKAPVRSTSPVSSISKAPVRSTSPVPSMSKDPIISMSKSPVPSTSKAPVRATSPVTSSSKSPVPSTSKAPVRATSPVTSSSKAPVWSTSPVPSTSKAPVPSKSETLLQSTLVPSTSKATIQPVSITSDIVDPKREKYIKGLEKLLGKLDHKIKKLQKKEMSLRDLDSESSAYIMEDKLKSRFVKVWTTLCKEKKKSAKVGREVEKHIVFKATRYDAVNEAVERFVNKKKIFPDFTDICNVVNDVHKETDLGLPPYELTALARDIFTDIGTQLKHRRLRDFRQLMGCSITDDPEVAVPDPAETDENLRKTLKENEAIGTKKMDEVLEEFSKRQLEMRNGEDDPASSESDDEGEEENQHQEAEEKSHAEENQHQEAEVKSHVEENQQEDDEYPETDAVPSASDDENQPYLVSTSLQPLHTIRANLNLHDDRDCFASDIIEIASNSDASTEPNSNAEDRTSDFLEKAFQGVPRDAAASNSKCLTFADRFSNTEPDIEVIDKFS